MRLIRMVALVFVLQLLAVAELGATEMFPGQGAEAVRPSPAVLSGDIFPPQTRVSRATAQARPPLLARSEYSCELPCLCAGDATRFFKKSPQIFEKESRGEYSSVLLSCLAVTGQVSSPGRQGGPGALADPPRAGPGAFLER